MKNYTDKELANFMLEMRQSGGDQRKHYFKTNKWGLAFWGCVVLLLLALAVSMQVWWFCSFVIGLVYGFLSRVNGEMRGQKVTWPFYSKVIDWVKVEKIASGPSPTDTVSPPTPPAL